MRVYVVDFADNRQIDPISPLLLKQLILETLPEASPSGINPGSRFILTDEGKRIFEVKLGEREVYHLRLSGDVVKSEKPGLYHALSTKSLGEGTYSSKVSPCIRDFYVQPNNPIKFLSPSPLVFKFIRSGYEVFAENEVQMLNAYQPEKPATHIPVSEPNVKTIVQMPLHEGKNLGNYDFSVMDLKERMHIIEELVSELERVHNLGNIHRDLKGSNILYAGNFGPIALIDFGLSTSEKNSGLHSASGASGYNPPERANYTSAADIYALGPIIAEILGAKDPCLDRRLGKSLAIIFDGIFEGYELPFYFERLKIQWINLLNQTANKNPTTRPKASNFKELIFQGINLENRYRKILEILNPIIEKIKIILKSNFLCDHPKVKSISPEDFDSPLRLLSKTPALRNFSAWSLNKKGLSTLFSTPTFASEANKIIDSVFSTFPMFFEAMKSCPNDDRNFDLSSNMLKQIEVFISAIDAACNPDYWVAMRNYINHQNDFGDIKNIISKIEIPLYEKLDLMLAEAKKIFQRQEKKGCTHDPLISALCLLSSAVGKENFYEELEKVRSCLQVNSGQKSTHKPPRF